MTKRPHLTDPPQPAPNGSLFIGPHGVRPFWALLLYVLVLAPMFVLLFIASSSFRAAGTQHEESLAFSLSIEWLQFAWIFFATWVVGLFEDHSPFDYGLQPVPRRGRWLATGALWGLAFMSLLIALLWSTHHLLFSGVLLGPLSGIEYGLGWALSFVGVAFFEEFFFRGYLQFNLTRCFAGLFRRLAPRSRFITAAGFWTAALVISFGFGLGHGVNPGESPIGLLCAGLAGLLFAFTLWRTGSLWWAIGLHAAWDWAQSFLFGVADSGSVSAGHLLASHPAGPPLLSGGVTGPEGSLFVLPVMALIVLVIALTLPRTAHSFALSPTGDIASPQPEAVHSLRG